MTEYKNLWALTKEIIEHQLEKAETEIGYKPFFRENQKTHNLELLIPAKTLPKLEKEIFHRAGFHKTMIFTKGRTITTFVIDAEEIAKKDRELAQKMVEKYNTLWKQKTGPLFRKYKLKH